MKAQVAVDAFLAFGIASLLLALATNFALVYKLDSASNSVYLQAKGVASTVASVSNSAAAANASVSYSLPCIYNGTAALRYILNASGTRIGIYDMQNSAIADARSAFPVSGAIYAISCPLNCTAVALEQVYLGCG
jgi:hypothetical protein